MHINHKIDKGLVLSSLLKWFRLKIRVHSLPDSLEFSGYIVSSLTLNSLLICINRNLPVLKSPPAHELFDIEFDKVMISNKFSYSRAAGQFGNLLPESYQINSGVGPRLYMNKEPDVSKHSRRPTVGLRFLSIRSTDSVPIAWFRPKPYHIRASLRSVRADIGTLSGCMQFRVFYMSDIINLLKLNHWES